MIVGLAAGTAGAAIPAIVRAQTPQTIAVATLASTAATWPALVCRELGLYKRYNLDVQETLVSSIAACAQQLVAGACDITGLSTTQFIETRTGGGAITFFLNQVTTPPYTLVALKQYKKYADLRGKTIIIGGVNDITHIFIDRMMATGGVKPDEFDLVYAGSTADRYSALHSGSVAAALLFPPFDFRAIDEGYSNLGSLPDAMPPFPFTGYVVRNDYLAKNPQPVLDFTKAYLRGTQWLLDPANRQKAIDMLAKTSNLPAADVGKSYDVLVGKYKVFPADGLTTDKTFSVVVDALVALKVLKPPLPPLASYYDNAIVRRALADLAKEPKT